jgi:ATP-dependent DNA ligase
MPRRYPIEIILTKIMTKKTSFAQRAAGFIETMDCLPVSRPPEGPEWTYEIKLDGYRLETVRSAGRTTLYSRRQNVLNQRFQYIATALENRPEDTVIDGELVALAPDGRLTSTFCRTSAPQNHGLFITPSTF